MFVSGSEDDELLYSFQTLHSVNRFFGEDGLYATGTFGYNGNKAVVHWEPGGFTVYSSTDMSATDSAEVFDKHFPPEEVHVREDGGNVSGAEEHNFEQVYPNHYQDSWDVDVVKGFTEFFGFCTTNDSTERFPDGENIFWVYSDAENFRYKIESTAGIRDAFPEILGTGVEEEVFLEDIADFATASSDIITNGGS